MGIQSTINNFETFKELAEARGNIYSLLSQFFLQEPSKEIINAIRGSGFLKHFSNFLEALGKVNLFKEYLFNNLKRDEEFQRLKQEYMNLFKVPGPKYVKPYESVYRDGQFGHGKAQGFVMGKSTIEVKKFYRQAGAKISNNHKDLPDHFGLELAFMQFLVKKELDAWKHENKKCAVKYLDLQNSFLTIHLTQWSDDFCLELSKLTNNDFYRGLAEITRRYISKDKSEVEQILKEVKSV